MTKLSLATLCLLTSVSALASEKLTIEMVSAAVFNMKSETVKKDQSGALKYFFEGTKFYEYFNRNGEEKVTLNDLDKIRRTYTDDDHRKNYELLKKEFLRLDIKLIENGTKAEVFSESRSDYVYYDKHYPNTRQST